jgi:hypothetical protein
VLEAPPDAGAPFAVVTHFSPEIHTDGGPIASFKDLEECCDRYRSSGNIFYAIRLDGHFGCIRTRAVNPPLSGTRLVEATKAQSEFSFTNIGGTLVGLWSPGPVDVVKYAEAFGAKGMMIRSPEEIRPVLKRALDYRNGPVLIGAHVDYSDNHKLFEMVHADAFQ